MKKNDRDYGYINVYQPEYLLPARFLTKSNEFCDVGSGTVERQSIVHSKRRPRVCSTRAEIEPFEPSRDKIARKFFRLRVARDKRVQRGL